MATPGERVLRRAEALELGGGVGVKQREDPKHDFKPSNHAPSEAPCRPLLKAIEPGWRRPGRG